VAAQTTKTGAAMWLSAAQNLPAFGLFERAGIEAELIERTESPILIGLGTTKG
jgi:hypothetical protein